MNYTEKQVEEILNRVWNDRIKGGGWDAKENFVKHFKKVKKCSIPVVVKSFYCHDKTGGDCNELGYKQCKECKEHQLEQ